VADRPDGDPASSGGVAWQALLAEAAARLRTGAVPSPDAEARWIVEAASGYEGAEFVAGLTTLATVGGVSRLDRMVARRLAGEPLQYVLGRWAFRTLDLMVDHRVLIPRPETEVVAGVALAELARQAAPGLTLLAADLGTGSGAIGLSLAAERADVAVVLTDASADALAVARANLAGIGRAATRVRVSEPGSWFDALPGELAGRLHVVVANPPYVAAADPLPAEVCEWEPPSALFGGGPEGTAALEVLIDGAGSWLAPGGALVLELAPAQASAMLARARDRGYEEVRVVKDLSGRDRALAARWPASPPAGSPADPAGSPARSSVSGVQS
jgi:release factor glutamine methyltransferase